MSVKIVRNKEKTIIKEAEGVVVCVFDCSVAGINFPIKTVAKCSPEDEFSVKMGIKACRVKAVKKLVSVAKNSIRNTEALKAKVAKDVDEYNLDLKKAIDKLEAQNEEALKQL